MLIQCDPENSGCGSTFKITPDDVKTDEYIQCPGCERFIPNPFYDKFAEQPSRSYLG